MNNKSLTKIEIDLNAKSYGELNEGYLSAFGAQIELLLKIMFGGFPRIPVSIRGTGSQIDTFIKTLSKEKRYMDAFNRHGLGDKRTFGSKYKLDSAVQNFEKTTGLAWPLK